MTHPWEPALDALEAWVRRTAEGVVLQQPPPPAPALPTESVPADLQLPLRSALEGALDEAEDPALRRVRFWAS